MLRSILVLATLGPLLFSLSSCGTMQQLLRKKPDKNAATGNPGESKDQIIGTIEMVNPEQRFVLVKTMNRMAVAAGTKLESHSPNGLKSVLTVTPEHKMNFISADITEGYPQQGDIVVQVSVPKPPDTPAPVGGDQPPPLEPPPPIVDLPLPLDQLPPPVSPPVPPPGA